MIVLAYSIAGLLALIIMAEILALFTPIEQNFCQTKREGLVSILLVVRNEEKGIESCVKSLLKQRYENFELLIADDDSSDRTATIIKELTKGNQKVTLLETPVALKSGLNPKAINLAELHAVASGKYIAVADGDCIYPPTWIESLLQFKPERGIVSGVTGIEGSWMQNIDWISSVARINLLNSWGFKTSAVGNNMLFDREAYDATSGWGGVSHHLTEDFEMNRQMVNAGFSSEVAIDQTVLVKSSPASFKKLFSQRKRWIRGARESSPILRLLLFIDALFILFAIFLGIIIPKVGVVLIMLYVLIKAVGDIRLVRLIDKKLTFWVIPYELYRMVMNICFFTYNIVSTKVIWKGRSYS